jgi:hypothetical protein
MAASSGKSLVESLSDLFLRFQGVSLLERVDRKSSAYEAGESGGTARSLGF